MQVCVSALKIRALQPRERAFDRRAVHRDVIGSAVLRDEDLNDELFILLVAQIRRLDVVEYVLEFAVIHAGVHRGGENGGFCARIARVPRFQRGEHVVEQLEGDVARRGSVVVRGIPVVHRISDDDLLREIQALQIGDRGHVVRSQRFDVPFFDIVFDLNGILVALHVRTRLGLADIFGPQHGIVSLRVFRRGDRQRRFVSVADDKVVVSHTQRAVVFALQDGRDHAVQVERLKPVRIEECARADRFQRIRRVDGLDIPVVRKRIRLDPDGALEDGQGLILLGLRIEREFVAILGQIAINDVVLCEVSPVLLCNRHRGERLHSGKRPDRDAA